jgi:hypothetical protein
MTLLSRYPATQMPEMRIQTIKVSHFLMMSPPTHLIKRFSLFIYVMKKDGWMSS